ncbi:(d)CMP kinase [Mongoliitalea daihaiensis]|uniref:(d)CMP kinase n=1 Tax=Mongoliitalea daihaiensis TaxID=2782006 RepID=UPI001F17D879|nr:(d)CMP kinase [Mongoliitalea daihaiensis]UJP65381.1 (d)CMP kinase [Mongoliitalea daihaiensis]
MNKIVIAIDGYSGCGKSSTAKAVAKKLGYTYIDSGAMYRSATLHFLDHSVDIHNPQEVNAHLDQLNIRFKINPDTGYQETYLNDRNVEQDIRNMRVSNYVSEVSTIKAVREALVAQQQELGKEKGVVMDGRDIGTVVFPKAELKVFMTANLEVRALRRQKELEEKGQIVVLEDIIKNLADRDQTDSNRKESPLMKAEDAVEIDTSNLKFEEQVDKIVQVAQEVLGKIK